MRRKLDRPTAVICLIVMLNAMGLGLIMPVMPELLSEFRDGSVANAAAVGGFLSLAFAATQFLCSPLLLYGDAGYGHPAVYPAFRQNQHCQARAWRRRDRFLTLVWLASGLLALVLLPPLTLRAVVGTAIIGETSALVDADRQGALQGMFSSFSALASMIAFPVVTQVFTVELSGGAEETWRSGTPFLLVAALSVVALALLVRGGSKTKSDDTAPPRLVTAAKTTKVSADAETYKASFAGRPAHLRTRQLCYNGHCQIALDDQPRGNYSAAQAADACLPLALCLGEVLQRQISIYLFPHIARMAMRAPFQTARFDLRDTGYV